MTKWTRRWDSRSKFADGVIVGISISITVMLCVLLTPAEEVQKVSVQVVEKSESDDAPWDPVPAVLDGVPVLKVVHPDGFRPKIRNVKGTSEE